MGSEAHGQHCACAAQLTEKIKQLEEKLADKNEIDCGRWQEAIRDLVISLSGASAERIDGGACESGDPLDFTKDEISQGFAYLQDEVIEPLRERVSRLKREIGLAGASTKKLVGEVITYKQEQRRTHGERDRARKERDVLRGRVVGLREEWQTLMKMACELPERCGNGALCNACWARKKAERLLASEFGKPEAEVLLAIQRLLADLPSSQPWGQFAQVDAIRLKELWESVDRMEGGQ